MWCLPGNGVEERWICLRYKGLVMALLPAWGDKVTMKYEGTGTVIFNPQSAFRFGKYLGNRYKRFDNIVWVLGGDRPPQDDKEDFKPVWKDIWRSWHLKPTRPGIDAEPCYEDHPINTWDGKWTEAKGRFNQYDVRKQLYRSVFAGGCGVTFGQHSIWQFYYSIYKKVTYADRYWHLALDRPAAYQAGYLRKLIESRPFLERIPDTSIIIKGRGVKADYCASFRNSSGRYMMIYMPIGKTITVNTPLLLQKKLNHPGLTPETEESLPDLQLPTKTI